MDLSKEDYLKLFEIFSTECEEHIQSLNSGILNLEKNPDQPDLIAEIFRDAHSLKGSARMIDITSVEQISHKMETILGLVKKSELSLSHDITNQLFKSLDTITLLVKTISDGKEETSINYSPLLEELDLITVNKNSYKAKEEKTEIPTPEGSKPENISAGTTDKNLFLDETNFALDHLISSLLEIEKDHTNKKELKNAYDHANALKGSARIVNFKEMGDLSFTVEKIIHSILEDRINISTNLISLILESTDIIKQFISQYENNDIKDIPEFADIYSSLNSILDGSENKDIKKPKKSFTPITPKQSQKSGKEKDKGSVRVSSEKLDKLMEQGSELVTIKLKLQQRLRDLQEIIDNCSISARNIKKSKRLINHSHTVKNSDTNNRWVNKVELLLSDYGDQFYSLYNNLESLYKTFTDDYKNFLFINDELQNGIKRTRLLPFSTIVDIFPRMVRDLAVSQNKKLNFSSNGDDVEFDKFILQEIKDPLMHMIRNCIDHGMETPEERLKKGKPEEGTIHINVTTRNNNAIIKVIDDGKGINIENIKKSAVKKGLYSKNEINKLKEKQILNLIFQSGFSTSSIITNISGRGIGMDVVKANVEHINGTIDLETELGKGTTCILTIPIALSTTQALKILISDEIFFLPVSMVLRIYNIPKKDISMVEGSMVVHYEDTFIPFVKLSSILEIENSLDNKKPEDMPAALLKSGNTIIAVAIDKFQGEEEILIKGLGDFFERVRNISGVTIMRDGSIAPVLNIPDIINTVQLRGTTAMKKSILMDDPHKSLNVLVVDDSIMTRTLEKNIIESYGYSVITAVDGQEGLLKMNEYNFDVIVSDIQMPNMDGFEFTKKIKSDSRYKRIPLILVTALESDEDKRKGIEAGADAYIVKSSFDQSNLLDTIKRLI